MTKRDFELIAEAIRESNIRPVDRQEVAAVMAIKLAATNPRFNAGAFIAASTRRSS